MQITRYSALAFVIALLLASSVLLVEVRENLISKKVPPDLERMIGEHPVGWTAVSGSGVDPKWRTSLHRYYDIVAAKSYQHVDGQRVTVVMTWSRDGIHRAGHAQPVCYRAAGFTGCIPKSATVSTKVGKLSVVAFTAIRGKMVEDVIYWTVTGGQVDDANSPFIALMSRFPRLKNRILHGIPDNLMVRVSSVRSTPDQPATAHLDYIREFLEILPASDRKLIMGF